MKWPVLMSQNPGAMVCHGHYFMCCGRTDTMFDFWPCMTMVQIKIILKWKHPLHIFTSFNQLSFVLAVLSLYLYQIYLTWSTPFNVVWLHPFLFPDIHPLPAIHFPALLPVYPMIPACHLHLYLLLPHCCYRYSVLLFSFYSTYGPLHSCPNHIPSLSDLQFVHHFT